MLNVLEKMIYLGLSCSVHLFGDWDGMGWLLGKTDL